MLHKALVIVDLQNDFCPGGSLAVNRGDVVAADISQWTMQHLDEYGAIVATKCWHPDDEAFEHFAVEEWPMHCIQGTDGSAFHHNFNVPVDLDGVFYKGQKASAYSGFEGHNENGTSLNDYLRGHGIDAVDVVGIATDYCVKATAIDAARLGFKTVVLMDLTAAVNSDDDALNRVGEELIEAGVALADAVN